MSQWGDGDPVVGMDLGTTNSCVAVWRNGRVEVIANSQGNRITPSYVAFKDDDRLIGEAAKNQSTRNPENTIYDAKRLMGRRWGDSCVQNDMKCWPFKLISGEEDKPLVVICEGGREKHLTPEEISSAVLQKMRETAEDFLGCSVKRAVVTVPAYFNDSQRQSTRDAGTIAGLDIVGMINEPTAAALAYGLDSKRSGETNLKKVLIFDLGGGTFDVSILEIKKGDVKVIATGGDTHLGGQDIDSRLVHHFVEEFKKKHKKDITRNPRSMTRLRFKCEEVKRSLTKNSVTDLIVESLFDGIDLVTKLSSAKFESLNMDLFEKCMKSVEQCLLDAHMSKHSIDDVVLVGGSTRISKLQDMVEDYFGRPPSKTINADEAVAFGAAIKAAKLGEHSDFKKPNVAIVDLHDVAPLSLGTPNYEGIMKVFIKRNTRIPVEIEQMWTLTEDFLTSTTFPIYEGEMEEAEENHFLGKLKLDDITPLPAYQQKIKVTFCINDDGILKVSSEDVDGGNISTTTINAGRLERNEMNRMIKEAHDYKLRHQKKKERDNVRCQLERCALDFTHQLDTNFDIPSKSKAKFRETCNDVLEWVQEDDPNVDVDAYRQKKEELEQKWKNLIE